MAIRQFSPPPPPLLLILACILKDGRSRTGFVSRRIAAHCCAGEQSKKKGKEGASSDASVERKKADHNPENVGFRLSISACFPNPDRGHLCSIRGGWIFFFLGAESILSLSFRFRCCQVGSRGSSTAVPRYTIWTLQDE
ncbi:uncharacterized protein UTRI_01760 [Ustilago trichophora]|uniref:Uncharacterized protein n=1 Tax=Ustilago trichophora TaxID=86804 RepID=A0A5C3DXY0_9BASI|nr:uncharacterized protein UTRI_01760 [Ustilago trichophora]